MSLLKLNKSLIRMCPLGYNVFTCRYTGLEPGEGGGERRTKVYKVYTDQIQGREGGGQIRK